MKVLIIEDQLAKATQLAQLVRSFSPDADITHASSAQDGFRSVEAHGANLVLLDVVLPMNVGDPPSEEGSLWFVREVKRKLSGPGLPFIVGTTQYAESLAKVQETFRSDLWSIVHVSSTDIRWTLQIQQAVRFAQSNAERLTLSRREGAERFDVAIITALQTPEFSELVSALGGGEQICLSETNESWLKCHLKRNDGSEIRIVAACVEEMGMTAMASLVTKVSVSCGPKALILVGIMAGNPQRTNLSDLIIIESTWNFQAGKLTENGFCPDVKSVPCGFKLAKSISGILNEQFVLDFWRSWPGERPQQIAKIVSGEVACSPYVVADGKTFTQLEEAQKRKIHGLEMEAFGCYDAVRRLGDLAPQVVCLKSVCDFGDGAKNDMYQTYCAALSASAVVHFLKDVRFDCNS